MGAAEVAADAPKTEAAVPQISESRKMTCGFMGRDFFNVTATRSQIHDLLSGNPECAQRQHPATFFEPDSADRQPLLVQQSHYIPGNPPLSFIISIWRMNFFAPPPFIIFIICCI